MGILHLFLGAGIRSSLDLTTALRARIESFIRLKLRQEDDRQLNWGLISNEFTRYQLTFNDEETLVARVEGLLLVWRRS